MVAFGYLPPRDRMALAHVVQSFGKFDRKEDPAAIEALGKELASAAVFHPNRITAGAAMAALEKEEKAPPPIALPPAEDRSPGAEALRRGVADPVRAARTLARTAAWRPGPAELARIVTADAPGNGFSASAATLTAAEWGALHGELLRRTPQ
jgi:hypothetical protein